MDTKNRPRFKPEVCDGCDSQQCYCPETNVELVQRLMTFSKYGAAAQIFIVEAISKYADVVSDADPSMFNVPVFGSQCWVGVAKEIKAEMVAKYGRRDE